MGTRVRLEVPAIGEVGGWLACPDAAPRGGLVVVQEIFGVNAHMRAVTERYLLGKPASTGVISSAAQLETAARLGLETRSL